MSFFPSLLFWNGNEKSFKTNTTKLQSVLPRCQTYNIQALSEVRRQNALKHGTWKLILTLRTEYLSTSDSRLKKKVTPVGMFLFYITQNAIMFLMVGLICNCP